MTNPYVQGAMALACCRPRTVIGTDWVSAVEQEILGGNDALAFKLAETMADYEYDNAILDALRSVQTIVGDFWNTTEEQKAFGADVGLDMTKAIKAVYAAKPMSVRQGKEFLEKSIAMLGRANSLATGAAAEPGVRAKREDLMKRLRSMQETLSSLKDTDAVSETPVNVGGSFGMISPAELIRRAVAEAIAQFNAAAESTETIRQAREQFYSDLSESAQKFAGDVADKAAFYTKAIFWVGLGVAGLVGYGAYRLLASQGASNLLGAYLGARRR